MTTHQMATDTLECTTPLVRYIQWIGDDAVTLRRDIRDWFAEVQQVLQRLTMTIRKTVVPC